MKYVFTLIAVLIWTSFAGLWYVRWSPENRPPSAVDMMHYRLETLSEEELKGWREAYKRLEERYNSGSDLGIVCAVEHYIKAKSKTEGQRLQDSECGLDNATTFRFLSPSTIPTAIEGIPPNEAYCIIYDCLYVPTIRAAKQQGCLPK